MSQPASTKLQTQLQGRPVEETVPYLLKCLHHSMSKALEEALRRERVDMSVAHLATLYTIHSEPGLPGAEMARRGFVTAQTMNTVLRRMERAGEIERRPHPVSPRADSWFVTSKGRQRLAAARDVGIGVWRRMLSMLAPREVTQLQGLLERCIHTLDVKVEKPQVDRAAAGGRVTGRAPRKRARGKSKVS